MGRILGHVPGRAGGAGGAGGSAITGGAAASSVRQSGRVTSFIGVGR